MIYVMFVCVGLKLFIRHEVCIALHDKVKETL